MSVLSRLKNTLIYVTSTLVVLSFITWGASFFILPWQVNKQLANYDLALNNQASMSFNPFILHLQIDDLAIIDSKNTSQLTLKQAQFNLSWLDLFSQELIVEKALIEALHLNVSRSEERLVIAGFDLTKISEQSAKTPVPEETESSAPPEFLSNWRFLMPKLAFNDIALTIDDLGQSHQVTVNNFSIDALAASLSNVSANVALSVAINQGELLIKSAVDAKLESMALVSASLDNQFALSQLSLADWLYLMPKSSTEINQLAGLVSLSFNQKITLDHNKWQVIQPDLLLALSDINVVMPELALLNKSFNFELKELALNGVDNQLDKASGEIAMNIDGVSVSTDDGMLAVLDNLNIPTASFMVDETLNAKAAIERIALQGIVFSKPDHGEALYQNDALTVNDISWADNHLSIDNIELDKFVSEVWLSEQKELKNLIAIKNTQAVDETAPERVEQPTEPTESATAVTISLNKFELIAPSVINFTDQSVAPHFKQQITLNKALITEVDSRDTAKMTPFDIAFAFNEHATTTVNGTIAPFGEQMNMTLAFNMSEFSLPPLSAYLRTVLGFDFLSGQLDNNVNVVVKNDEIDGDITIDLRGFELASGNDTTDLSASDGSAIGLNSALNMLKDSQGNVSLNVPLSGDINDPSFGVNSILTLVVQKAIMSQAKSYLVNTFVPYANVLTVVSIAGEYLLRLEMNDLVYQSGQVALSQTQQPFVSQLGALLTDKPEQQVKICAISNAKESASMAKGLSLDEQMAALKTLANGRGNTLKKTLIEQYNIESARLLLCAPKVDGDTTTEPRIEFSF